MLNDTDTPAAPQAEKAEPSRKSERGPGVGFQGKPRDLGKISLVISLLSLVLVTIFFFGLNRNLSGLTREVQDFSAMKNSVNSLDAYVDDILGQMGRINAQLLDMDARQKEVAVRMLMESMLEEMIQKTTFLTAQLGNAPEAEKLRRVRALLMELKPQSPVPASSAAEIAPEPTAAPPVPEAVQPVPAPEAVQPEVTAEQPAPEAEQSAPEPEAPQASVPLGGGAADQPRTMTQ
ncbi:MAG: hypothetical protein AB7E32_12250 [Desulfovibrio sp.]